MRDQPSAGSTDSLGAQQPIVTARLIWRKGQDQKTKYHTILKDARARQDNSRSLLRVPSPLNAALWHSSQLHCSQLSPHDPALSLCGIRTLHELDELTTRGPTVCIGAMSSSTTAHTRHPEPSDICNGGVPSRDALMRAAYSPYSPGCRACPSPSADSPFCE